MRPRPGSLGLLCALLACKGTDPAPSAAGAPAGRTKTSGAPVEPATGAALPTTPVSIPAGSALAPSIALPHDPKAPAWLSWLERRPDGTVSLAAAALREDGLDPPQTVVEGPHLLANWADVPRVAPTPGGALVAAYLVRPYEIRTSFQRPDGTWSEPIAPHRGTAEEFGFPALFAPPAGAAAAAFEPAMGIVWIQDGTVRATTVRPGAADPPVVLDPRTCECCRVAAVATPGAAVVAYRDRSPAEVRDIAVVRLAGRDPAHATAPAVPAPRGWTIAGCPVNGPQAARAGTTVALTRFDGKDGGRVDVLFSTDGGARFEPPVVVQASGSLGRAAITPLRGTTFAVVYLSKDAAAPGRAQVLARTVHPEKGAGPVRRVGTTTAGRDSGFPVAAAVGRRLFVFWTDVDEGNAPRLVGRSARIEDVLGAAGKEPA